MVRKNCRRWVMAGALLILANTGCSTTSGSSNKWLPSWFGSSANNSSNSLAAASPQPSVWQKFTSSVKQTFTGAGSAMSDPLKGKPPAPDDPTSLANPAKPSAETFVQSAIRSETAGNTAGAIEQFNKALSITPDHLGALLGLALLYDRQGDFAAASKFYLQAAAKHPNQAAVLNNLGLCQARQGKFNEAAESLQRAIAMQPDKALYRNNLANVLIESNQVEQAIALLTPSVGIATAHYNVGYLLYQRGRNDEALRHFERALQADPQLTAAQTWIREIQHGQTPTVATAENAAPQVPSPTVPPLSPANDASPSPESVPSTNNVSFTRPSSLTTVSPVVSEDPPPAAQSNRIAIVSDQPVNRSGVSSQRSRIAFSAPSSAPRLSTPPMAAKKDETNTAVALDQPLGLDRSLEVAVPPDVVEGPEQATHTNIADRMGLEGSKFR